MSMVENRKIEKASINPLSMDEVKKFLEEYEKREGKEERLIV